MIYFWYIFDKYFSPGKTAIWSAKWPTTTHQPWLHRLSQVNLHFFIVIYFSLIKSRIFIYIILKFVCFHRKIQLCQKIRPLHNSWSNENLQCKCQYMVKGWFSKFCYSENYGNAPGGKDICKVITDFFIRIKFILSFAILILQKEKLQKQ